MGVWARLSARVRSMAGKTQGARAEGPHRPRRAERTTRPRLPAAATADPLAPFWSDLEWFVTEDPDVVAAMIDLGVLHLERPVEVAAVRATKDRTVAPGRPVVDMKAPVRKARARSPSPARLAAPLPASSDPLRAYLENLDTREDEGLLVAPPR